MEIKVRQGSLTEAQCDLLVVNLFEGVKQPGGGTGAVDKALGGLISEYVIEKENFKGKLNEIYVLPAHGKIPADKVLIVGLGKSEEFNADKVRQVSAAVTRKAKALKATKVCTLLHGAGIGGLDPQECARSLAEGATLAGYKFDKYKSKKDENNNKDIQEVEIVEMDSNKIDAIQQGVRLGQKIGEATNFARNLINEPAAVATPTMLAETAKSLEGLNCRIIEKEEAEQMGMNAFLAVSYGSAQPPKFIHLSYTPANAKKKIAIIGKGVTFDSGGLDIKPASSMVTMKDDMSGSAAVLGIMKAVSELKPDVEVHGIIAATENMPGSKAYKPGDVLKAMNGKTIEIDNTDAEGRLTLADALTYAIGLKPDEIVDIATLTGACMVALGRMACGIMGNKQDFIERLIKSGEKAGERLWQLPMYEEFMDSLKSDIADFKNSGGREAGASVAGVFLKEFVDETPWAHIDIAGPAWLDKDIREASKGATGAGVRTMLHYILSI